jgi:signal peptidase II
MVARTLRGVLMLLLLALVGCDHATKVVAKITLEGGRTHAVIPGILDLVYAENRDTAFSLTRNLVGPLKGWLLIGFSCVAVVAIAVAWWKRRGRASAMESVAFVLVVAGAIGNVADRIAHGYVVDFIHIHRWPVFNVADMAICAGALLMGIRLRRETIRASRSLDTSER